MFRYILFDSSQQLRFHQKLQQWDVLYRSLFEGHAEEALPEMAPLLIDVTIECEATRKVLDETARIGKLKPCVSMLESTQPLFSLAEHLDQFHLVETPEGRSLLLRWYDTRILPVWLDTLTEDQRDSFTRPITQWISIDRFGIEQQHAMPKHGSETPAVGHTPFRLNERQVEQLFAAAEPDVLIFELRKILSKQIDSIPHRVLYPFVHTHWQMAQQRGLLERNDQVLFLGLALYTSGRFMEHPIVAERFASPLSAPERSFTDWFNKLPQDLWDLGKPLWECPNHEAPTPNRSL